MRPAPFIRAFKVPHEQIPGNRSQPIFICLYAHLRRKKRMSCGLPLSGLRLPAYQSGYTAVA